MLTIQRLTRDRSDYYLGDLTRELPADPGRPTIEWVGSTAPPLGLEGPVDAPALRQIWEGRHPGSGQPLRTARVEVLAYDLTFSAPKSASVLFAVGGPTVAGHVVAGHAEAVAGALSYMEAHAVGAVRGSGEQRTVLPVEGVAGASFLHGVSRQGDPHLHTHVVLANLVHGEDGRWSAGDQRGLWAHRAAASAVYEAHLRHTLTTRLGTRWAGDPLGPTEVVGLPAALLGEFSSRAADIRRHAHDHGARSSHGRRVAWAATRPAKSDGVPFDDMTRQWQARAVAALGEPADLTAVLGHRSPTTPAVLSEHRVAAGLSLASPRGAHRRDVVAAFAQGALPGASATAIDCLAGEWVRDPVGSVGVSEPAHPVLPLLPSRSVLGMLGPRPIDAAAHAHWRTGARAIDQYESRWGRDTEVLGSPQASWSTERVVEHLRVSDTVATTRRALGLRAPVQVELERGR